MAVPHFTSVINWTLRLGLFLKQSLSIFTEPWLAIADLSIDIGCKKLLVVLAVPTRVLEEKGTALGLQDVVCIGSIAKDSWTGKDIFEAFQTIFSQVGVPTALIQDGGSELKKGAQNLKELEPYRNMGVVYDVGHKVACILKAYYAFGKGFQKFVEAVSKASKKIQQSNIAFLAPPKLRTKGRFLSISAWANWAKMMESLVLNELTKRSDVIKKFKLFLPNFSAHRVFLKGFCENCKVIESFLALMKNKGLNESTAQQGFTLLSMLSSRNKIRKSLEEWLKTTLNIHRQLGIGQIPLLVSSDVLESLFGKFKYIIQRSSKGEFNRLILSLYAICGDVTPDIVSKALHGVTHIQLLKWQAENLEETQKQKRMNFQKLYQVPKSGKSQAA